MSLADVVAAARINVDSLFTPDMFRNLVLKKNQAIDVEFRVVEEKKERLLTNEKTTDGI